MSSEKEEDASEPNTTEETENTADEGFVDLGEDVDDLTKLFYFFLSGTIPGTNKRTRQSWSRVSPYILIKQLLSLFHCHSKNLRQLTLDLFHQSFSL